jgi:hypothetical protein
VIMYPTTFPVPMLKGYGITVNPGLARTVQGAGYSRQRQLFKWMPETYGFDFAVKSEDLSNWTDWVNEFAYQWFELDIMTHETFKSSSDKHCSHHVVRFISDLEIQPLTDSRWVQVAVVAELAPREP